MHAKALSVLAALAAGAIASPGCRAAALTVSPILIETTAAAPSASLTLQNRDARPVNVQIRVFAWSQQGGDDKLEPTTAVEASPPIVEVRPKSSYVVRLHRSGGGEPVGEEAYRVVVDELPDPDRQRNGMVNILLRYNIPMFVDAADAGRPRLAWTTGGGEQARSVTAENTGDKRIQITNLSLKAGQRSVPVAPGLSGYVLGHSARTWLVPGGAALAGATRVLAGSDHGAVDVPLAR